MKNFWNIELYPNPASNRLSLVGQREHEFLKLEIRDVSGRLVLLRNIYTTDFMAILDVNLIDGLYLVRISNYAQEIIIKKLVIAK